MDSKSTGKWRVLEEWCKPYGTRPRRLADKRFRHRCRARLRQAGRKLASDHQSEE